VKATNPSGDVVYFNERDHQYTVAGKTLTSVTKWTGSFFPAFDAERIAKSYAVKHGLQASDVLSDWKKAGMRGSNMGTAVHRYAECEFNNLPFDRLAYSDYEEYFQAVDHVIAKLLRRFWLIGAEVIVFSPSLGLAGTVDLLMRDPENKDVLIFDWKTNKTITTQNSYNRFALSPIGHLDDCHLVKYSLQLNTYKNILETESYYPDAGYRMALIHLENDGEGNVTDKWFKVRDMNSEIDSMINWT